MQQIGQIILTFITITGIAISKNIQNVKLCVYNLIIHIQKMMQMIKSDKQLGLNFNQHTELYDILISKNNF